MKRLIQTSFYLSRNSVLLVQKMINAFFLSLWEETLSDKLDAETFVRTDRFQSIFFVLCLDQKLYVLIPPKDKDVSY